MPKRGLIFSLAYFPWVGGAEVAVKAITDLLTDFNFDLITTNLDGREKMEEQIGPVRVMRLGHGRLGKYWYQFSASRLATKLHREKPYDFVWAIMANQAGWAGAIFKHRHPTVPFILTLQEGDDLQSLAYRARLLGPRLGGVFHYPDEIQAISHYLANWARQMGATAPVTVIPNGVDVEELSRERVSAKGGPASGWREEKIIITTSRLVKKNGVDILIKSLQFLPPSVKLRIVGGGPEEKSLKQLTSRLNLAERVEFLGSMPPQDVPQCLAEAEVFARPSRSEGLGNSFLEAMATGVPTVGTPVGGIPDFLKEGETGWLCEVANPKSLAEKIKYILEPANVGTVTEVVKRARQLVFGHYRWQTVAEQMSKLFL